MEFFKSSRVWIGIGVIVVIIGSGFGVYRYWQLTSELNRVKGSQTNPLASEEVKKIVTAVGKLMELPQGEEPTVATVTDVDKLRDQPFFQRAQNEDKVLIFTSEKRAILYRPGTNKIIDVAPVNLSQTTATGEAQINETVTETNIALYNGTNTAGLVKRYEAELLTKVPNVSIVARENAASQNTPKTVLIDLTGNNTALARNLASTLGIVTGVLPDGESAPAADFLIIIGTDKAGPTPTTAGHTPTPTGQ